MTTPTLELVTFVIDGVTHTKAVPVKPKPDPETEGYEERDVRRWWMPFHRRS